MTLICCWFVEFELLHCFFRFSCVSTSALFSFSFELQLFFCVSTLLYFAILPLSLFQLGGRGTEKKSEKKSSIVSLLSRASTSLSRSRDNDNTTKSNNCNCDRQFSASTRLLITHSISIEIHHTAPLAGCWRRKKGKYYEFNVFFCWLVECDGKKREEKSEIIWYETEVAGSKFCSILSFTRLACDIATNVLHIFIFLSVNNVKCCSRFLPASERGSETLIHSHRCSMRSVAQIIHLTKSEIFFHSPFCLILY